MKKMKAIIVSENKELIWADSEKPEISDNEVLINKKHYLRIGDFCKVVIEKSEAFDLYGSPVNEQS